MRIWHQLRQVWKTLFASQQVNAELDEELRHWVDELTERHLARGVPPEDARRLALVELGDRERAKEEAREVRRGSQLDSLTLDVRYGWRALRRAPSFTAAAIVTFALGIGATTAIFSVVKAVLVEPFPYRQADQLMLIWADLTDLGYPHAPLAGPELAEFRERTTSFSLMGGVWSTTATIGGDGDPDQLRVATVTPDFFEVLGVPALHGRVLGAEDFGQSITPVLLSHPLWQQRFGGDPEVVGRAISWNERPARIVGVMGPDFQLLFPPDAAVPADLQAWIPGGARPAAEPRGQQYLRVVARRHADVSLAAAIADVASVGAGILAENPGSYTPGSRFYATSMKDDSVRPIRPALLALLGAVVVVLLMACVNVAGLLIVRAAGRARETQVRLAIGAGRGRLTRQACVEGVMVSVAGALAGLVLAYAGLRSLVHLAPASVPRITQASLDPTVLLFALVTTVACAVVFSVLPLGEILRVRLEGPAGLHVAAGRSVSRRLQRGIVALQIALGLVLMVGAGLMGRTFTNLTRVDPGFETADRTTFRIAAPFGRYRGPGPQNEFHKALSAELSTLPGVRAVGSVSHLPYDNLPNWGIPYLRNDEPDPSRAGLADARTVSPDFFASVQATLLAGRFHTESDVFRLPIPVVVDELMLARLGLPAMPSAAVGQTFKGDLGGSGQLAPLEIIGVVGHLRHRSLMDHGREQVFISSRIQPRNPVAYVLHTEPDATVSAAAIREAVSRIDARVPIYDVRPLEQYVSGARAATRFTTLLVALFAGVALLLACVGVYGVMAYAVSRREHEFGVRLALGAQPAQLLRLVVTEGLRLFMLGALLGLVAAALVAPVWASQLYETTPHDLGTFLLATTLIGVASMAACWLPARRAADGTPLRALRAD